MGRYLSPSRAKLQAKGVSSVRSRVMNLREAAPELTVKTMGKALTEAFSQVYGLPLSPLPAQWLDGDAVAALEERNRSWEWNYGSRPACTASAEGRFSWGGAELLLTASLGKVTDCRMYTDAMEQRLPEWAAAALTGVRFTPGELAAAAGTLPEPYGQDLRSLLLDLDL